MGLFTGVIGLPEKISSIRYRLNKAHQDSIQAADGSGIEARSVYKPYITARVTNGRQLKLQQRPAEVVVSCTRAKQHGYLMGVSPQNTALESPDALLDILHQLHVPLHPAATSTVQQQRTWPEQMSIR